MKEAEWHKYLTKVELDELRSIYESSDLLDKLVISKSESYSKIFRRDMAESEVKVTPYIRLAMARKDKPDIRKYKFFSYRILSRLWDMLYSIAVLLVFVLLIAVVVKVAI